MEDDEKMALLGLLVPADADTTGFGKRDGGRRLTHAATTVDHHIDGFMHPVKDQGGCGSCWAFAANTALEGTIAKKTNSAAVRISEQQLVDCTLRQNTFNKNLFGKDYGLWGCGGGWMDVAWRFQTEQGYMLDSDYPYTSRTTRTETQCAHDPSKVVGNASGYRRITDVDTMKTVVQAQPVSIALDAGQAAFQYYKSGVVQMADNCGTSLNHAVVVVGYSDGEGGGDVVPPAPELTCNVTKWWHTCTDESGARMLQGADSQGLNNYWKIQNSWGSGWGDGGFIRIAIEESG
jgi:C1A family cysteine protease